jgi:hypothetical protein
VLQLPVDVGVPTRTASRLWTHQATFQKWNCHTGFQSHSIQVLVRANLGLRAGIAKFPLTAVLTSGLIVAASEMLRGPEEWSREEAFIMTGHYTGVPGDNQWQPTQWGGSDIVRPLRRYAADYHTFGSKVSFVVLRQKLPGTLQSFCVVTEGARS